MLLVGLFVYASVLDLLEAVDLESSVLMPLSAGFLFRSRDWRKKNRNHYRPFTYLNDLKILYRRVGTDGCRVCYGPDDCFFMNLARCNYYVYTADIVDVEESGETLDTAPELKFEVDSLMYNLVDRASGDPRYTDCIPLLSQYTDCTKENICLGCKTCECDVEGRWNCTLLARCRPENDLHEIDHQMLMSVVENLRKNQEFIRKKRSEPITQETVTISNLNMADPVQESNTEASVWDVLLLNSNNKNDTEETAKPKASSHEIAEWLQEMHLDVKENKSQNTVITPSKINNIFAKTLTTPKDKNILTGKNNLKSTKYESDYLAFDEVLQNISVDSKNASRRKSMPAMNPVDYIFDYMSDDGDVSKTTKNSYDENVFYSTITQSPFTKLDIEAVTEAIENSITEIVIDLLESAKINNKLNYFNDRNFALLDYMDISDKLNTTLPEIHPDNDGIAEINSVNIMKRDVRNVTVSTKLPNVTTTTTTTTTISTIATTKKTKAPNTSTAATITNGTKITKHIDDLHKNLIDPLTNIVDRKDKEIEELRKIRENLMIFLEDFENGKVNVSSSYRKEPFFKNNKQHIISSIKGDVRTSNMSHKERYQFKLKRDVYEVIKDIVSIQKLTDPKKLPDDLKFLIRAMKHYVHKQGFHINNKVKTESFRRRWNTVRSISYDPIRENVIKILEVIDRDMPLSTGLYPLSRTAKKILKRIIKKNYIDEFAMIGLRVYDPNYNLTNDLRNIGTKWKNMMDIISASPPTEVLYATKLLHLELSIDISKMNDALSLIIFAHRRSMVPVDELIGEEIISQISVRLDKINKKIEDIVHIGAKTIKRKTQNYWKSSMTTTIKSPAPKISFLQQIKSLLRNSKRDILDLIRKKVPKTDVLKELARKQLDINRNKLSDYEKTMSNWQHNFGILPSNNARRRRGSNFAERMDRNRMKSIIPRYLRGKVRPAIDKKSNKKTKSRKSHNNTGHKTTNSSSSTAGTRATTTSTATVVSLPTTLSQPPQTSYKIIW